MKLKKEVDKNTSRTAAIIVCGSVLTMPTQKEVKLFQGDVAPTMTRREFFMGEMRGTGKQLRKEYKNLWTENFFYTVALPPPNIIFRRVRLRPPTLR